MHILRLDEDDRIGSSPADATEIPKEVIGRYAYKRGISFATAGKAFQELEDFLDASLSTGQEPTKRLDDVWHEFILHTKLYRHYCEARYGRIIDHIPTSPMTLEINGEEREEQLRLSTHLEISNGDRDQGCRSDCSRDCRSESWPSTNP